MIEKFACRDLTAFDRLSMNFAPGLNIIIGENGTGKTHIMKAAYALSSAGILKREPDYAFDSSLGALLRGLFMPQDGELSNLCRQNTDGKTVLAADFSGGRRVSCMISRESGELASHDDNFPKHYTDNPIYIPSRECVSFLRGFVGLSLRYELPFDRTYRDIAVALDLPNVRPEKLSEPSRRIIAVVERVCGGRFDFRGGGLVILRTDDGEQSAACASEGLLKFAALSRLLENGAIRPGESGPIFWDMPESNMNPKLLKVLAGILLELARNGQQVVISTHSYVLLKYISLLSDAERGGEVRYHALARDGGTVRLDSVDRYEQLPGSAITDAYFNLFDIELERAAGRGSEA